METRCFLRTLGPPALLGPAGDPVRFRVKKHLALLAYLAVEPTTPHRRDALADFLWPQATASEGRHSLATALSVLRARLGRAAFDTTRDTIRFTGVGLELDLTRLASGDVLGADVRPPLEVGAFLDGLDIPDADEFLRWKERHQARLLPSILEAMVLLIDRCRRTADSRQMERIADRMLGLDPLSEDAVRAKMESRALAGDRVTALRAFEEFRTQLGDDLGAAPSLKLELLAARLRRRGWERTDGPSVAPVPPVATQQWRGRPFIGRAAEHRALYEAWERMQKGEPGHVLVRGDSGIGKTTIVERLCTAAVLEGATASRVQCYELEREIPYAAVTGLVLGLLDKPGASGSPPESLAELSRTVPEVRQRFPSIPPPIESHGETARVRLTEAMHDLVTAIAEEHPVILVVDDLHLADDASLAVLHLLIRRAAGQPFMLILTVRQGELGRSPQALRLLESTGTLGFVEVVLPPLPVHEASELLDSLIAPDQRRPGAAARRALLGAGAGYPMVLELLLQDWQANGDRSLALSLGAMTAELQSGERAQAGPYEAVFDRILRSVDSTTRAVLNLGAVLGHRLNALPMYGIVELGLGQAMHGLSELSKLRVLRDGGQRMEFVNELLRACAYRAVPSPVRKQLHSEVADWLLAGKKGAEQAGGLELAWHCIRAGRQAEAEPFLLRGAREALSYGAPYESERALSTGIESLSGPVRIQAQLILAGALQEQGRWIDSLAAVESLPLDLPSDDANNARILRALGSYFLEDLTVASASLATEQLAAVIESSLVSSTRIAAANALSVVCGRLRVPEMARTALASVESIAEPEGQLEEQLTLLVAKALLAYHAGDTTYSECRLQAAAKLLQRTQLANSLAGRVYAGLASHDILRGDYYAALEHGLQAYAIANRVGDELRTAGLPSNLALYHARLGNVASQIECAEQCLRSIGAAFRGLPEIQASYFRSMGYAIQGRVDAAVTALQEMQAKLPDRAPRWAHQLWSLFKADVLAVVGRRREAIAVAAPTVADAHRAGFQAPYAGLLARWTALCVRNRDEANSARDSLLRMRSGMATLALLDKAEITCAIVWVNRYLGVGDTTVEHELRALLASLPAGVGRDLERIGVLERS